MEDISWQLVYRKRALTINQERNMHPHARAKIVKEWRQAGKDCAEKLKIPSLDRVDIEVIIVLPDRRIQDVANGYPAVKGMLDGIVDAGVLVDDKPPYVNSMKFWMPRYEKGIAAVCMWIAPASPEGPTWEPNLL